MTWVRTPQSPLSPRLDAAPTVGRLDTALWVAGTDCVNRTQRSPKLRIVRIIEMHNTLAYRIAVPRVLAQSMQVLEQPTTTVTSGHYRMH